MNFELLDAARNFRSLLRSASVENLERLHLKLANDADGSDFDLHLDGLLGAIQGEMKRRVVRAKDDA